MASLASAARPRLRVGLSASTAARAAPLLGVVVVAAVLRLLWFDRVPPNPWYDAAVRSMGLSWHNFFFGAFDPTATVSVDKAPVDLWLQVATTKVLGMTSTALRVPQAIAGITSVALVYDIVRRGFDRISAVVAGLALAVLPVSVLTSRSDTMDTLMGTALIAAMWVVVAAPSARRSGAVVAAGALAGLAFEIKLFEAAVAVPPLAVLCWLVLADRPRQRVRVLVRAAIAFVGVAAAWPVVASTLPGQHPFPLGSSNGTIWNVILVYNGLNRLGASGETVIPTPGPSPWRLFTLSQPNFLAHLGLVLIPVVVLGSALLLSRRLIGTTRPFDHQAQMTHAVCTSLAVWVGLGFALFSIQGHVRLRYMEAFTPALAATFGITLVAAARALTSHPRQTRAAIAALTVLFLAQPVVQSVRLGRAGIEDSQTLGAMKPTALASLSAYLNDHRHGARYLVAANGSIIVGPLIARDAQPTFFLSDWHGRAFASPAETAAAVRAGDVRYALMYSANCVQQGDLFCPPSADWAMRHGIDVTREAGLGPDMRLLRLTA